METIISFFVALMLQAGANLPTKSYSYYPMPDPATQGGMVIIRDTSGMSTHEFHIRRPGSIKIENWATITIRPTEDYLRVGVMENAAVGVTLWASKPVK